jgi:hypothetical protein
MQAEEEELRAQLEARHERYREKKEFNLLGKN